MSGIRRAFLLATGERYFTLVANFATFAIVSRLLTPAEIGVAVLGGAIGALALAVREFSAVNFIVQRKELSTEDVRAMFTVLAALMLATALIVVGSAHAVAAFYKAPQLGPYLHVVAVAILIEVISAPVMGLLRREMQFAKLARINVTGAAITAGLTIVLALLGFSVMSFAWAWLVSAIVVASLYLGVCADRSIFKPCTRELGSVLEFGAYNGATAVLYRLYDAVPYFALGRILSVDGLAIYNRSVLICQLPDKLIVGGVTQVLLAAYSAEVRTGRSLREIYLRSIELVTALQWPALVLLAILADPAVRILVGDQWLAAVPLVRIMAIASMFNFCTELNYPVLVSMGAVRDVFARSLIVWPVSAGLIVCAAFFGLEAAALAWLVALPFQTYVSISFVRRHVDVSWSDIAASLWKATVVSAAGAAGPLAVVAMSGGHFDLSFHATVFAGVLGAMGWLAGLKAVGHPLLAEIRHAANAVLSFAPARWASGI